MRLLLGKSKETLLSESGKVKVIGFSCISCEKLCATEIVDYGNNPISHYPYGDDNVYVYTRIIFGIHPEIIWMKWRTPVRRNTIYFCDKCSDANKIMIKLAGAIYEATGNLPKNMRYMEDSAYDPRRGCWITYNDIVHGQEGGKFNFQTDIDTYNEILAALMKFLPGNPFRISDLGGSKSCCCPV